jgi:hypothetical protein
MNMATNIVGSIKGREFLYKLSYCLLQKASTGLVIINIHRISVPKCKPETFKTSFTLLQTSQHFNRSATSWISDMMNI